MDLYVIQYQGEDYKKNDDDRTKSIYVRDCGLTPIKILDEPGRAELIYTSTGFGQSGQPLHHST